MAGNSRTVVVLGGGISGLTFTYTMTQLRKKILTVSGAVIPKVILLEKENHTGGWMTSRRDEATGAIFENGPRSLRARGSHAATCSLNLAEHLGLSDQVIYSRADSPAGKNRLIYFNGQLTNPVPSAWYKFITAVPPLSSSALSIFFKELRTSPSNIGKDESVHNFFTRRLGSEAADYLIDPMVRGIIGGKSRETSMTTLFETLKNAEQQNGSILKFWKKTSEAIGPAVSLYADQILSKRASAEKWVTWNFKNGLQTFCDALESNLGDTELKLGTPCKGLVKDGDKLLVHTDNEVIKADLVVSTLNANITASLLNDSMDDLSTMLNDFTTVNMAVTSLEYPIPSHSIPQAFGHLIPSCEGERNLGVIYDSIVFPEHDRKDKSTTRLTCMMGGAWFNDVFGDADLLTTREMDDTAVECISKQLGIKKDPIVVNSKLLRNAIPQYSVGFPDKMARIDKHIRENHIPLSLLGPAYERPGVNDCIRSAQTVAYYILRDWDQNDFLVATGQIKHEQA